MSEVFQAALTVLGGILVFATGQMAVKFLIEPWHAYKRLVGEIAHSLVYYDNVTTYLRDQYEKRLNALAETDEAGNEWLRERLTEFVSRESESVDDARTTLRHQASELMATTNAIPVYGLWSFFHLLPRRADVNRASSDLIGLSNSLGASYPASRSERKRRIAKCLDIRILYERFGE